MSATGATAPSAETKIGLRQAVNLAREHLQQVYDADELDGLRLEETEIDEQHNDDWLITFSLYREGVPMEMDPYAAAIGVVTLPRPVPLERDYKQIRIDAHTGKVKAMTIRQL